MTNLEWHKQIYEVNDSLEQLQLKKALDTLYAWIDSLQNWQLKEQLIETESTYKSMLNYFAGGTEDPQQEKVYTALFRSAYKLSDMVRAQIELKNSSSYYLDKKRMLLHHPVAPDLKTLTSYLEEIASRQALNSLLAETNSQTLHLKKESEEVIKNIFDYIWLSDHLSVADKGNIMSFLSSQMSPLTGQCLIISALTLSLLEFFDESKIELLLDNCKHPNEEIRQRAIVGTLLVLKQYDGRLYLYPEFQNRLRELSEERFFIKSIENIIRQFILSKDTERITRKINEEILPEMMKISPILSKKIKLDDLMSDSGMEEKNPEWKDIIEESGLSNKLQEFSELQMEGADVMHSSFAHLKSFPFFNDISNWFLPFTVSHSEFMTLSGKPEFNELSTMVLDSSILCNSDKYSFYLSMKQMPESIRTMVSGQFSSETSAIKEMQKTELPDPEKNIHNITNQYIRDLYRFFKLHPRRMEFYDIFEDKKEFFQAKKIQNLIINHADLQVIGEYYFSKSHYSEALEIFDILLQKEPDNAVLYQKRAYCKQMNGLIKEALEDYLSAESLHPSNSWTIKKIASCYRILKMPENSLIYYRKAEQHNPDNLSVQLNIGHCFLELKNYTEALKCYFKVEYLDKDGSKAWRPIAWCAFLTGKYQQALDYYNRILSLNPDVHDYLNMGHTYLAMKNIKQAVICYKKSVTQLSNSYKKFLELFLTDLPDIMNTGINQVNISLVLDLIQYELDLKEK